MAHTRVQMRILLLRAAQSHSATTTAGKSALPPPPASATLPLDYFAWSVHYPTPVLIKSQATPASSTPSSLPSSPPARPRRLVGAAARAPAAPFYSAWLSTLSKHVSAGEAWLSSTEGGPWRQRARRAFQLLQSRIDPREGTMGEVRKFVQRARREEQQQQQEGVQEKSKQDDEGASSDSSNASSAPSSDPHAAGKTSDASTPSAALVKADPPSSSCPSPSPSSSFVLTFLYPSSLPLSTVRRSLLSYARERHRFHSRATLWLTALLPLSAAAFVLPGPNVFFAINAYRLLGHYEAREGAGEVMRLIEAEEEEEKGEQQAESQSVEQSSNTSDQDVEAAATPVTLEWESYEWDDSSTATDDGAGNAMEQLCKRLQLDPQAVEEQLARWSKRK